jgi:hypothetical protein
VPVPAVSLVRVAVVLACTRRLMSVCMFVTRAGAAAAALAVTVPVTLAVAGRACVTV